MIISFLSSYACVYIYVYIYNKTYSPYLISNSNNSHMATSTTSSSSSSSYVLSWFFIFLLLILLPGSCNCSRMLRSDNPDVDLVDRLPTNPHQDVIHHHKLSFRLRAAEFNYLPRGVPVPPSGPSKRHNAVVDSVSPNRVDSPWEEAACFAPVANDVMVEELCDRRRRTVAGTESRFEHRVSRPGFFPLVLFCIVKYI